MKPVNCRHKKKWVALLSFLSGVVWFYILSLPQIRQGTGENLFLILTYAPLLLINIAISVKFGEGFWERIVLVLMGTVIAAFGLFFGLWILAVKVMWNFDGRY